MKKILNKKNLIFVLMVLLMNIAMPVYAAPSTSVSINQLLNEKISGWYLLLRALALALMLVLLIILGIRVALKNSAEQKALLKTIIPDWIVGMILVFFIHYFMMGAITLNEAAVAKVESMGQSLSGMEEGQELSLYEAAISKAYEIKFTSGTIGMILYIMLVGYTCKFVVVYLKRYINVITLILLAPIVCFVYAFKKVISGKGTLLKQWFKEFIYNVFLQTLHATIYATLIGLTIKYSSDTETFIGAILTMVIFKFAFKLDKLVRKLFNMVGGSTAIPLTLGQELASDTKKIAKAAVNDVSSGSAGQATMSAILATTDKYKHRVNAKVTNVKESLRLENIDRDITELGKTINGEYKEVSAEAVAKEQEKINNAGVVGKSFNKLQGVIVNLPQNTKRKFDEMQKYLLKKKDEAVFYVKDLQSDVRAIKSIPQVIRQAKKLPQRINQIPKNLKNNKSRTVPVYNDYYEAVVDPEVNVDDIMKKIKLLVDMSVQEVTSAIIVAEGYQALLCDPKIGFAILAEENYKSMIHAEIPENERKIIKAVSRSERRVYKFGSFGNGSIKTITQSVTDSFMKSNSYMRTLGRVEKSVKSGELRFRKVDGPLETIKYTANAKVASKLQSRAEIAISSLHTFRSDATWAVNVNLLNQYEEASSKMTMDSFTVEELKVLESTGKIIRVNGATPEESGYIIADVNPMNSMAGEIVNEFLINNPENPLARKINDLLAQAPENEYVIKLSSFVIENQKSSIAQIFEYVNINEEGKAVIQVNNEIIQNNLFVYEQLISEMTLEDNLKKAELEDVLNRVISGENVSEKANVIIPLTDILTTAETTENMEKNIQMFIEKEPDSEISQQIKILLEQNPENENVLKICNYIVQNKEKPLSENINKIVVREDGSVVLQIPKEELKDDILLLEQITNNDKEKMAILSDIINNVKNESVQPEIINVEIPLMFTLDKIEPVPNVEQKVQEFIQSNPEDELAVHMQKLLEQKPEDKDLLKFCGWVIENKDKEEEDSLVEIFSKVAFNKDGELVIQLSSEELKQNVSIAKQVTEDYEESAAGIEDKMKEITEILKPEVLEEPTKLANIVDVEMKLPIPKSVFTSEDVVDISEMVENIRVFINTSEDSEKVEKISELLTENPESQELVILCDRVIRSLNNSDGEHTINNFDDKLVDSLNNISVDETGQIVLEIKGEDVPEKTEIITQVLEEYKKYTKVQEDIQQIADLINSEEKSAISDGGSFIVEEKSAISDEGSFIVEEKMVLTEVNETLSLDGLIGQIEEQQATNRLDEMLAKVVADTSVEYELVYNEARESKSELKYLTNEIEPQTLSFDSKSDKIYSNDTMKENDSSYSTFDEIMESLKDSSKQETTSSQDVVLYSNTIEERPVVENETTAFVNEESVSLNEVVSSATLNEVVTTSVNENVSTLESEKISKEKKFDNFMERLISGSSSSNTISDIIVSDESVPINVEIIESNTDVEETPKNDFDSLMDLITGKKEKTETSDLSKREKVVLPRASEKVKPNKLRITSNDKKEEQNQERLLAFYIYGEVKKPGRYLVKYGSKVYEAINNFAGGFTKEADKDAIAEKLNIPIDENITGISIPKKVVSKKENKKSKNAKKDVSTNEVAKDKNLISCYITGAIRIPGEKSMKKGSKVIDLIERAGGYTDEVNLKQLPQLEEELIDGQIVVIPKRTIEDEYADRGISLKKVEDIILSEYQKYKERIGITLSDIEKGKKHREIVLIKIKEVLLKKENIKLSKEELEERLDAFIEKQRQLLRKSKGKGRFISDATQIEHRSQIDLVKDMLSKQFSDEENVIIAVNPVAANKEKKRAQIVEQLKEFINLGV